MPRDNHLSEEGKVERIYRALSRAGHDSPGRGVEGTLRQLGSRALGQVYTGNNGQQGLKGF